MELIIFLVLGAISGWIAGQLFEGGSFGLVGNIIVGIVGSLIGGWVAKLLGIGGIGWLWHIIIAVAGAWLLLFIISLIKKA
jgi:uncharacterized membrane protein YeaQ/YmgE (transglycosylase-associated protein family)